MENTDQILKALADETRLEIVSLLLRRNYCVGALAHRLGLTEAAVSQHLKLLREAGLLKGEKNGYFMHYEVDHEALKALAAALEEMAAIERVPCEPDQEGCMEKRRGMCRAHRPGHELSEAHHPEHHGHEAGAGPMNGHGCGHGGGHGPCGRSGGTGGRED